MGVSNLRVYNVRSYEVFSVELDPLSTLILGRNGVGKTSLLESLYLLHRGTSFKGRDRDVIGYEKPYAEMKATFSSGETRSLRLSPSENGKIAKQFTVPGKKAARLSPAQRLPVVLFEPDELRLLTSSPARRREFIDGIISRLSPTYSVVISRFQRTLLQRNELLKQYETLPLTSWESHLFAWDVKLAELSATIIKARRNFTSQSNAQVSKLYSKLAGSDHEITATYETPLVNHDADLQQAILARLEHTRISDARRGYTSTGPHRDDISIMLDNHLASESASRGEMRSIMLAFKLFEVELQEHHSGKKPLLLLDDVFSELDITREKALLASLSGYQTVITATDLRNELKETAKIIQL